MGFLDRLAGRSPKPDRQQEAAAHPEAAQEPVMKQEATSSSGYRAPELQHDSKPSFGPPSLNMPAIGATGPAGVAGSLPSLQGLASPSGRLYDPYEGLSAAVVGKKQLFKLPEQPEFVFEEEIAARKRGWTENLQFYTGVGYLAGGVAGVAAGAYTYATVKPDIPLDHWRLKANRLLNLAGSKAKPFGNGAGILGLFFASTESFLANVVDLPGVPDVANSMAAGAISGALFRAPRGPRQALAAGIVGVAGGLGIAGLRTFFPSL